MHFHAIDPYLPRQSLIHRLDARVKVMVTLLFIAGNALLPDGAWAAFLAAWGVILLGVALSRLAPALILRRGLVALPFALAAVSVVFTVPGVALATWQIGPYRLVASDAGLLRFASIVVRSWLSLQMALLLTATTPFPDLMHALRHLRVPALLVAIAGFTYRYLFVLADEAARLLRARAARSARPAGGGGGGTLPWRARVAGSMVAQLFLRSLARSERVHQAMVARGYRGRLLTMTPHVMARRDWLVGGGATALLFLVQVLGRWR